jgi:hypothetical protein
MRIPDFNPIDNTQKTGSSYPSIGPYGVQYILQLACLPLLQIPQLDSSTNAPLVVQTLLPVFLCAQNALENAGSLYKGVLASFNQILNDFQNNPLNCSADIASFDVLGSSSLQNAIDQDENLPDGISNTQVNALITLLFNMGQSLSSDPSNTTTPPSVGVLILYNLTTSLLTTQISNSCDNSHLKKDINTFLTVLNAPSVFNYTTFSAGLQNVQKEFNDL